MKPGIFFFIYMQIIYILFFLEQVTAIYKVDASVKKAPLKTQMKSSSPKLRSTSQSASQTSLTKQVHADFQNNCFECQFVQGEFEAEIARLKKEKENLEKENLELKREKEEENENLEMLAEMNLENDRLEKAKKDKKKIWKSLYTRLMLQSTRPLSNLLVQR